MMVISDSGVVTGLADGEYIIDGRKYCVQDGTQRVKGGQTLSGGACYVDGGVRNLVSIGIPVEDALYMASGTPADRIGLPDIGKIAPGQRAHIAGFDRALTPLFSVIGGWRS